MNLNDVLLERDELQGDAVVAPAFMTGRRPVVEPMPLMTTAFDTVVLSAGNNDLEIQFGREMPRNTREETGPACSAVVFHL